MNLIKKLYNSTLWSLSGLKHAAKNECSFKLELIAVVALTPLAFFLALDLTQLLLLLLSLYNVLVIELINTAIEATVDRIGTERNDLSKTAKDAGSAAVFISIMIVVLVWGAVIWSRI